MANGASATDRGITMTYRPPSQPQATQPQVDPSIPDMGGQSVDQFLGDRPGEAPAVQPPQTAASDPNAPGFFQRYGEAALSGAAGAAPLAAVEAMGIGTIPLAVGTLGMGALGGMVEQGVKDVFPNAPGWVAPVVGMVPGFGTRGLPMMGSMLRSRIAHAMAPGVPFGLAYGAHEIGQAASYLANHIVEGAGAALALPTAGGIYRLASNPRNWRNWSRPVGSALGGVGDYLFGPESVRTPETAGNPLMPVQD